MLLLTETVLFYWDYFSSTVKANVAGVGKVKDWMEKSKEINVMRLSASRVTNSKSNSRVSSLSNPTSLEFQGSAKSSRMDATQPLPTPGSAISIALPASYLDEAGEDDEPMESMQRTPWKRGNMVIIPIINVSPFTDQLKRYH